MPLAITLGFQAKGRDAEPTVLYAGLDAGKASEIANNPGPGFARTEYLKAPAITFRRYFEAPEVPTAPVAEAPAEEPTEPEATPNKAAKK